MRVRIVRKLADRVDGIDLTNCDVGEVIELPDPDGRLIIAEEWGVFARRQADVGTGRDNAVGQAQGDRRHIEGDLYQRLRDKQEELDRRDRRQFRRRMTDDASGPSAIAP
jgi:hypothetical protein